MKKMLLVPIIAFSYNISNTKNFSQVIKPDTLKTILTITLTKKTLKNAIENTNKIISLSKQCKKITYRFSPYYEYKNKKRIFVGYKTTIHETCYFKKPQNFSMLLENISKYAKVELNSIDLILSNSKEIVKNLKLKAYNFAIEDAKKLSTALNKKCILKNITFNTPTIPTTRYKTLKLEALNVPLPKNENKINVISTYNIECF